MRLDDGFPTTIRFSENPNVKFWEKTITPPGIMGGGGNETTTMRNTRVRTKAPKKLLDVGDMALTVAYDPEVIDEILEMAQVNQKMWIEWPDGSAEEVWGWIDEFNRNELTTDGEQPTADVVIVISNQDNDGEEVLPEYLSGGYPG